MSQYERKKMKNCGTNKAKRNKMKEGKNMKGERKKKEYRYKKEDDRNKKEDRMQQSESEAETPKMCKTREIFSQNNYNPTKIRNQYLLKTNHELSIFIFES
jgi:hypothetical protein